MEKDGTDGVKTKEQDANTDAVRPTRTRTLHGEHYLPQLGQCHPGDPKTARSNSRQAARHVGRHPETGQVGRNTRTDIHKIVVKFVRCGGGSGGSAAPFTGDQRTDSAVQSAAPLCTQSLLNIRPAVAPDRRPDPPAVS